MRHIGAMFVEDGGTLIVYSKLQDGVDSRTFLPWFKKNNFVESFRHLSYILARDGRIIILLNNEISPIRINPHFDDFCTAQGLSSCKKLVKVVD